MSDEFARLHETREYGQIVVMKDTCDKGNPALAIYFSPPHLGTCNLTLGFGEGGWDKLDKAFGEANEANCIKAIAPHFTALNDD